MQLIILLFLLHGNHNTLWFLSFPLSASAWFVCLHCQCYYCCCPLSPPDTVLTVCASTRIYIVSKAQNTILNITYHVLQPHTLVAIETMSKMTLMDNKILIYLAINIIEFIPILLICISEAIQVLLLPSMHTDIT